MQVKLFMARVLPAAQAPQGRIRNTGAPVDQFLAGLDAKVLRIEPQTKL